MAYKEKWIRLGYDDLAECLAKEEIDRLNTLSLEDTIQNICQKLLDSTAASFRGAFAAKGYVLDTRDFYIPQSYKMYALALARYFIWSRFPNSKEIALDEPRYELYKRALELLKDPVLATPYPDYSDDPELSSTVFDYEDPALTIPYLRLPPQPFKTGFAGVYFNQNHKK